MKTVRSLPHLVASLLLGFPFLTQAASTIPGDVTGLWFDALHPGWGLNLAQQNDAAVATLFIYDANGAPAWYVASRLEGNGIGFDPCGTLQLTGPLFRTQWPSFGSAANPSGSLQVQSVGTLSVSVHTFPVSPSSAACNRNTAGVQYSIDGVATTVTVSRQTWASNQAQLYGQFLAGLTFPASSGQCPDVNASILPAASRQLSIIGSADDSNPAGVRLAWGTGVDTSCEIRGSYTQGGQFGGIAGALSCGPIGSPIASLGQVRVSRLYASDSGFVGEVSLDVSHDSTSCIYVGAISGARRP